MERCRDRAPYTVTDPDQVLRYEQLLHPWVNHADTVVAIEPGIINGLRIIAPPGVSQ
jgi:hypothetical protein